MFNNNGSGVLFQTQGRGVCGHDLVAKTQEDIQRGRPAIDREMSSLRRQGQTWAAQVIAAIRDKAIIDKILTHLDNKASSEQTAPLPQVRALPVADLFT